MENGQFDLKYRAMPKPPQNDLDRQYVILAFRIIGEFGASIAAPVVILTVIGKRLDAAYGTGPAFLSGGFVLAAVISAAYVVKRAKTFAKEYEALTASAKGRGEGPDRETPSS